jgi:hypothetical protein
MSRLGQFKSTRENLTIVVNVAAGLAGRGPGCEYDKQRRYWDTCSSVGKCIVQE